MSDQRGEWVSAYLDDEITSAERARASHALSREAEARRRLGRYQMIGEALRGELPQGMRAGFASRVYRRIVQESHLVSSSRRASLREFWVWIRNPVPLATAGGLLAALGVAGLWLLAQQPVSAPRVAAPTIPSIASAPESDLDAKTRQRILGYLAVHAEVEPRTLMPYAQLVEYEE